MSRLDILEHARPAGRFRRPDSVESARTAAARDAAWAGAWFVGS
jgi:hypothetical protein